MNMHPGDLRSIEENRGADSTQKEETPLIDPPHVTEMTEAPIHIEAEVTFLVESIRNRIGMEMELSLTKNQIQTERKAGHVQGGPSQ